MPVAEERSCVFYPDVVYLLHDVRVVVFGEKQIRFTPTEYGIVEHLLTGYPVSDKKLIADLFHSDVDIWTKDALDKHISNLRRKIKKADISLNVLRVSTFGYAIVSSSSIC